MKDIPFNVELIDKTGRKCIVFGCLPPPSDTCPWQPLVGASQDSQWKYWRVRTFAIDDPGIVGLWAERQPTEDEKVEMFRKWLRGANIECRERKEMTDDWEVIAYPSWEWKLYQYRVGG